MSPLSRTRIVLWLACLSLAGGCGAAFAQASQAPGGAISSSLGFTLEDFFTAAVNFNPDLRISEERLNIGSARRRAANGRLLPQVNAGASVSDNRQYVQDALSKFDGHRYNVQLTQILFDWQQFSARSQAYLVEDQLEAEYYAQLALLLTDVAERYFDVLEAEDALESIRSELTAVSSQLNLIESYYERQLAQITDLYGAQARLAAVQAEALELQSRLDLARDALSSVAGLTPGQLQRLDQGVLIPRLDDDIDSWVRRATENNPLIRATQYARQAAGELVVGSRGAYMPRVSLILQRQDSDVGFDNAQVARNENNYIGVNVSIPLYAGGSNRAAVSEAISQREIAENQLRKTHLEVGERTRAAYLLAKATETRTEAAAKLLESTTLSAQAKQQGFELGTVNSVEVLDALREQFQAQRDLQRTRYEHIKYLLQLKREAGTLTAEDLVEVDTWLVAPGA